MLGSLLRGFAKFAGRLLKGLGNKQNKTASQRKDNKAWFRVDAVRDSKTCPICKTMDKRKVELPTRNGFVSYAKLSRGTGFGKENLIPPYHPNCRCTLKPVFGAKQRPPVPVFGTKEPSKRSKPKPKPKPPKPPKPPKRS